MEQLMLDLIPAGAKATCHVSQYDIGRTIRFNLTSGGTAYSLSGTETIKVYIKKPDGTTAERNIANTSSTYVDWVTGEGDCDVSGKCECELVITAGSVVIGSKNFTMKVEDDPYDGQGVVIETAGPAPIATFTTNIVDLLQSVKCGINAWSDSNIIEKEPYNFRKVAGTATRIGNHLFDKLVGGTVAWNQIMQNMRSSGSEKGLTFTNNNNFLSINGTVSEAFDYNLVPITQTSIKFMRDGRKYLILLSKPIPFAFGVVGFAMTGQPNAIGALWTNTGGGTWSNGIAAMINLGDTVNISDLRVSLIDLTAMFGSTIADYIYSLEQATAGAGVAWFRKLFPNSYYPYDAGSLKSVKTTAHKMVGKNIVESKIVSENLTVYQKALWIEAMLKPSTQYTFSFSGSIGNQYYANENLFSWNSFTVLSDRTIVTVTTKSVISTSNALQYESGKGWIIFKNNANQEQTNVFDNLQLELGSQATAYEPYTAHNYALDDVELRGLFKLDSNNKLYADGDTYESSGEVTRKWNKYTFTGTETWSLYTERDHFFYAFVDSSDAKSGANGFLSSNGIKGTVAPNGQVRVYLRDNSQLTDSTNMQSVFSSGTEFIYEKATPTTETADPFTNPQQVDANGTEEYIDSRTPAIPVGHETYYAQAYSECNVTANGTTHNIQFGELVVESAELDVTNGILKRHDDTTKQLTPLALEAVIGQNSVSCDTGDTEVKYLYNA